MSGLDLVSWLIGEGVVAWRMSCHVISTCVRCVVIAPLFNAPSPLINTDDCTILFFTKPSPPSPPSTPTPPTHYYTVRLSFRFSRSLQILTRLVFFRQLIMSAAERVQNHPVYVQAQGKANYYVNQLDKEVIRDIVIRFFNLVLTRPLPAQQLPCLEGSRATHSSSQGLHRHRLCLSPPHSPCVQLARCPRLKPPRLGTPRLPVPQGPRDTWTSG